MIEIKDIQGQTRVSVPIQEGAKGVFTLMNADYIQLSFSSENVIPFKLGDYADLSEIEYEGLGGKIAKVYEIVDMNNATPTYNESTGGYDYTLRLDAYYWKWKNKIFKYTPENAGQEASWSLTAALDVHLNVFLRNLKALGYTYKGTEFTYSIDSTVENKAVSVTYDNINLLDALFTLASENYYDCDCWVTDNVIHFGRNEFGDSVKIERGVEAVSVSKSESKGTYATRIYAFGGTRNIPTNYRPTDEQAVVNGVVQKRLMLPEGTQYIDAYENMTTEEAIEDIVVFDNIYPRRVGTLSDVTTVDRDIVDGDEVTGTYKAYQYKDTGLVFDEKYIIEGQELKIVFQSGRLNGMEFSVTFNPNGADPEEQLWEIVANEDYGRLLPDETIYPEDGDEYVLSGFDIQLVSDQYIPEAEQELLERAKAYAAQTVKDDGTYTATLFSDYVYEDQLTRNYEFGQRVNLIDDSFFENGRESRIIGWEIKLDIPFDSPKYTIGESMPYSRIGEIEDKVDSLTYKGQTYTGTGGSGVYVIRTNDSTAPSDSNVFSALRSLATFLRKDRPDQTEFLVKFLKGIELGKYTTGLLGTGGAILIDEDGNSHAEFDYLNIRKKALFTEITVQELKHIGGALIISPAAMIISSVEETEEGYKCFFDKKNSDGKIIYNEFEPGDQGRCQTFNLEKQNGGQIGNRYWWRLVTEVGEDYVVFSKTDCDVNSDIPQAGDNVAQLGNRTDKTRQNAQVYSAYGSDSPSRKMYQGIDSYDLTDKDIKSEYYDITTGRFREVTYGDAYFGDKEGNNYFKYDVDEGVDIKGKVQIAAGSTGWNNIEGISDEFDSVRSDAQKAQESADKAQSVADNAYDRLDEWASDGVISPTEKLALKQEIQNLQAEYETNIKNAEKYGIDCSQYKSRWESYKAELEYHSTDTPENIPIRDSFRTSQSAFYTSRTELLTAIADATKEYADKLLESFSVGAENLLLNTGFTGNYEDEKLSSSYKLTPTSLLYSNRMFAWEGKAEIVEDENSASGFAAVIGNLSQSVSTIPGENYVVSYKAKGNSVTVMFGGSTYTQPLTSSYVRYVHRFTSGSSSFSISGDATVCELKLERGTVATDWCPSRKDRNEVADRFKYFWYLQDALQSATQVNGGLVLTTMIMLGKFVDGILQKVNAGISGIYNDDTDVAVWAGGTYEDAIRTVQTLISKPNYQPSDEEWKSMAKFVATHGGDSFFRGFIYALGGVFRGRVETNINGRRIVIDPSDNSLRMYDANGKICLDMSFVEEENGRIFSGITVTEYEGEMPFFTSTLSGRRLSFDNLIENYGGIISPDRIFFSNQRSTIFDLKVSDLVGGGKCIDMFANGWNTNTDPGDGHVFVDKSGFMRVGGYSHEEGFTGEVLVHPADKAADRIYLVFENGIMVGTKNG